ncbi:hypothetical protein [Sulfurimonas sp. CS5]|uniref:hypothetical protein n=1 Tax=Sulfurimonas sp. CS5 TaxID=3391145 RepID=UPI0039E83AFE
MNEPAQILAFVSNFFNEIKVIYKLEKEYGAILYSQLKIIFDRDSTIDKLFEYEILEEMVDESIKIKEVWYTLIESLLDETSLDMPEQISKYHLSLTELYTKLKSSKSKNEVIEYTKSLDKEISKFESQLKRNIKKLIEETRYIKVNNDKLNYKQKMKKASELSSLYLEPFNIIMQNHSDSLMSIIADISEEANKQRFLNTDIIVQRLYTKVYTAFCRVEREVQNNNRLLINEVGPLLERIKSESVLLSGFSLFLRNNKKYEVPKLLQKTNNKVYFKDAIWDAKDIWDGYYEIQEDVVMQSIETVKKEWMYDETKYLKKLEEALPVNNFYNWIYTELTQELEIVDSKMFLQLSKLIHNRKIEATYADNEREKIRLEDKIMNVPIVGIKKVL